ncbi:MAG: hypothetical protein Q8O00_11815 [Holophaga sp.]|nr:hypothetical protein [Holophaga sp.]
MSFVEAGALIGPGLIAKESMFAGLTFSQWGTVAMGASTAMSGAQLFSGAMQQDAAADASRSAAEMNALRARDEAARNARVVEIKAERDKRLLNERFEREQGARRAWFGMAGDGESPLELLAGAAESHELDLQSVDYTRELDVQAIRYGGESAAAAQGQQAAMHRARGQNAMNNMPWGVGETLLSGGAKTYRYMKGV